MRLDKCLADKAFGTRSEVRNFVKKGRITLNGAAVKDPGIHVKQTDKLMLDGKLIDLRTEYHLMLHKPQGILTAARDKKQATVMDLLPAHFYTLGCMPVGRLDKDTTGLLLFTTDGQLNHLLLSPKRHVEKVYFVTVLKPLTQADCDAFAAGIVLSDCQAMPAKLEIITANEARVTICEGKFHQIKRMFHAIGNEVIQLKRESFGSITLDESLNEGEYRELTDDEVNALRGDVLLV